MIENVKFENFRGFKNLQLEDVKPVTLISGKNNAGKSSVLDGLFLYFDHTDPDSFRKLNLIRNLPAGVDGRQIWESTFNDLDLSKDMCISVEFGRQKTKLCYSKDTSFIPPDDPQTPKDILAQFISSAKHSYTLKFSFSKGNYTEIGHLVTSQSGLLRNIETSLPGNGIEAMPFTQYTNSIIISNESTIVDWIGKMELSRKKEEVIRILQILDPFIEDISTISLGGQVQLYTRVKGKLLPLKLAGDGLNKLLFITLSIIANPGAIILIDEIDAGFHYSMFPKLWEVIVRAAHDNSCQIVATTHSYECIAGAISGAEESGQTDDFCYFRLAQKDNDIIAYRYSDELLRTAIDADMEVR